ncbi:hypothetical protein [[Mycoplasma] gypis]|uniref:Uncharacterized protein n=1 Tax=[Mycoplasma] gypis TaxID=92404 RepID=A0ABZ2RQA0_9BACT|nr:hypothetical protein [[Mycoplasma] gypis]MBN0919024.1 hypothetical protein [[Mycoplasma] gypis]
MKRATMAPIQVSRDIKINDNNTIYSYNLIDGTKHKHQKASYLQNLKYIYKDGFEDGDFKTFLFNLK